MSDSVDWRLVSFVRRSSQRKRVLTQLNEPLMPKEIAEKTDMHQSHVSRTLTELQEKDLVELLNPEDKHGRLYRRTEKAEKLLNDI